MRTLRLALAFAVVTAATKAGTIVSVTGPHGSTLSLGATNQVLVTSWSATHGYSAVDIGFESNFGPFSGTAYLMTQIGPGTTVANEVANQSYSVTGSGLALTNLFAGLTLSPGTYFLVVTSSDVGGWDTPFSAGSATVTTGIGVTRGAQYIVNDSIGIPNLAYAPASAFASMDLYYDLKFQATGQESIPEPGTWSLLGSSLAAIIAFKSRAARIG